MSYRFVITRLARVEQWNGQYTRTHANEDTAVTLTIIAATQAEAIEKAKTLSGTYTGPSSSLYNGRETVNHGWIFRVVSAEEISAQAEVEPTA